MGHDTGKIVRCFFKKMKNVILKIFFCICLFGFGLGLAPHNSFKTEISFVELLKIS